MPSSVGSRVRSTLPSDGSLAVPPLCFTRASPPSGCTGDFHPQASSPLPPFGDRSGLQPLARPITPSADFCAASGDLTITPVPWDTTQISWGKPRSFPRTPAGFTAVAFDGYGLRDWLPACPATTASLSGCCSRPSITRHAQHSSRAFIRMHNLRVRPLQFNTRYSGLPRGVTKDVP